MPASSLRAHVVSRDVPLRSRRNTIGGNVGFLVLLVTASLSCGDSKQVSEDESGEDPFLTIEVIDLEGRPVAGALLGQRVVSMSDTEPPKLYGLGNPEGTQKTDETGRFHLNNREIALQLDDQGLAVCAYHPDRELIGLAKLTSKDLGTVKKLVVSQGCRVDVKINSSELDRLGYPFGQRIVMLPGTKFRTKRSRIAGHRRITFAFSCPQASIIWMY